MEFFGNTRFSRAGRRTALRSYKVNISNAWLPRSFGDSKVCLGLDGLLSSGTLWRRGCARRSPAHGAGGFLRQVSETAPSS